MHNPIRLIGPFGKPIRCFDDLPSDPADVIVLQGRPGDRFKVKAWESNGHVEYSARRETVWEEIDPAEKWLCKQINRRKTSRIWQTSWETVYGSFCTTIVINMTSTNSW